MILDFQGSPTTEDDLLEISHMQPGGLNPEGLVNLCRTLKLTAIEQELNLDDLTKLVQDQRFPIVFLFREPLDGEESVHAVIPVRMTRQFVVILDPLQGKRRVSLKKFEHARRLVGKWVVIWKPATSL
jgi:ABC-type bacteriocin/lantibiotic exporter with double-glycine peptidase domain